MFNSKFIRFFLFAIVFLIVSFLLVLIDAKFIEPEKIVITKHSYNLTGSADSDPVRVVLVSDIHIGSETIGDLEKKVSLINQQNPDLILIAGDFVNSNPDEVAKLRPLRELRAKYGTYAVLGNHDYALWTSGLIGGENSNLALAQSVSDELESDGINVLRNEFEQINIRTKPFELYGSDDLWSGRNKYLESNLNLPKIILVHERIAINETVIPTKSLILSGHTHCGEVRIPFVTQYILANVMRGFGDVVGGWNRRNNHVDDYVTCGLTRGTTGFRLFTNPEITVIDIN
ncbi:metallophosphoesterase [Candidatus Micrarchaeota archaeon]|nr:metallophosphoesterase [Candidatus Micrarchaeota archaeon]